MKSFASIKDHPSFPPGSFSAVENASDIKEYVPNVGREDGRVERVSQSIRVVCQSRESVEIYGNDVS